LSDGTESPQIPWQGVGAPFTMVPPGLQAMAVSALFFSLMSALAKLAGGSVPIFEIVFARSIVVAVLSGAKLIHDGRGFRGREPRLLILRGVLGFGALSCFYFAVVRLPLADATVIHFMNPVFTAFMAAVVLGEHLGMAEALLVLTSLGGVLLVARPAFLFGGGGLAVVPVLVGLCGALLAAGAYVAVRRLRGEPPMLIVFYFAAVCTVLSAPFVAAHATLPAPGMLLVLLGVGVSTHLGQTFVTWGFRLERAGRASAVGYLQIVFAAAWGWLLFHEVPDLWTGAGAVVIVAATLALVRLHPVR
jgi:drug/metabolite transporter (DMT)-like permease